MKLTLVYLLATILESPVARAAFQSSNKALTSLGVISPSTVAFEMILLPLFLPNKFISVDLRAAEKEKGLETEDAVTRSRREAEREKSVPERVAAGANALVVAKRDARRVAEENFMVIVFAPIEE